MPKKTAEVTDITQIESALEKKYDDLVSMDTEVTVVPTGVISLDAVLGVGGWPQGRLIELYGPESCGKSTLAIESAIEAQKQGVYVTYLDYEHSFSPDYATALGLEVYDKQKFKLWQPATLEQGHAIIEAYIKYANRPVFAVVDSVAAMTPKALMTLEPGDEPRVGEQARRLSQMIVKLNPRIARTEATVVFINHIRDLIGHRGYGPQTTTPGGRALKFYASVRVELKKRETIKEKLPDPITGKMVDTPVAIRINALVVKNKCGVPWRSSSFWMRPPNGVSEIDTVMEVAQARGLIKQAGAQFTILATEQKFRGRAALMAALEADEECYQSLRADVVDLLNGGQQPAGVVPVDISDAILLDDVDDDLDDEMEMAEDLDIDDIV